MEKILVLPSALKQGVSEQSLLEAWENYIAKRPRGDDIQVRIGFDTNGAEIEMVALITADGKYLIIHGMAPSRHSIRKELGLE